MALGLTGFAAFVDDEAAVGVTVEGQSDVGVVLYDRLLEVAEVLRLEWIGLVVRKGAVELEVERHDIEGQRVETGGRAEDRRDGVPAHSVPGVDDDLERPVRAEIDQRAKEPRVVRERVALRDRAGGPLGGGHAVRPVESPLREIADLGQAAVLADRSGAGAAELDPVVLRGVVARGEHRAR
jgi:hypothetical protein